MLIKKVLGKFDIREHPQRHTSFFYEIGQMLFRVDYGNANFVTVWAIADNVGGSNTLVARMPKTNGIVKMAAVAIKRHYALSPATFNEICSLVKSVGVERVRTIYGLLVNTQNKSE